MVIIGEPQTRGVWVDDVFLDPKRSQRLFNHSPDGFNWGYEGSGPAQLALAVLLAAGLCDGCAVRHHQAFKREFIARLPVGQSFVLHVDVSAWYQLRGTES
jgi:hypothetical protein